MKRLALTSLLLLWAAALHAATPETLVAAGRAALSRGEVDQAVNLFEQAIKLRPNDSNYHLFLASAYGRQANQTKNPFKMASLSKKTKAELDRAVQLDPNNLNARFGVMDFYDIAPGFMGGSREKAIEQANEIRKRDSLAGHRAFASLHARAKKMDLVHKEFEDAIREQPASARPHYFYAVQLYIEKNYKGAAEHLEEAARIDPAYMPTFFRIGQLAATSTSNYGRGEEALKKYLAHTPADDEPPHNRTWYWLGQLYEKTGNKSNAKQAYLSSLKIMPGVKEVTEALKRVS